MSKHTPGPWAVDYYGDVVANGEDVAHVFGRDDKEQSAANARLMAAAPEMLEALRYIASTHVETDEGEWMAEHARRAIAKATGDNA